MKTLRTNFAAQTTLSREEAIVATALRLAKKQRPSMAAASLKPYVENIAENKLFTPEQKIKLLMTYTKLLCANDRFQEALPFSALTCSLNPNDVKSWTRHAFILKHMGEFATAETIYKMAITAHPTDVMARTGLADLYEMQGNLLAAADMYRSIVGIKPDDFIARDRLLSLQQG